MLPGMDGLALIDELRERRIPLPVIILSAKRSVEERVEGLQAGGDDYLTKPFAFSELLARVQALIRRATKRRSLPGSPWGTCTSTCARARSRAHDRPIDLQPREFALLEYLARNAGRSSRRR